MDFLLQHGVERGAIDHPDRPAIALRDEHLTYGELDANSNQIANLLLANGLRSGDRVGIYLDKSLGGVATIYGILKAGGVYVPLDPAAPPARIAYIAADCGIRFIASSPKQAGAWKEIASKNPELVGIVVADPTDDLPSGPDGLAVWTTRDLSGTSIERPPSTRIDDDLALILYTSGSTGNPKGVMLSHRNVMTFTVWAADEFDLSGDDQLTQMAPWHFDLSTFDLYAGAHAGATTHLVSRSSIVFPMEVRKLVEQRGITVMYAVPSILTMLVERAKLETGDLPSLRTMLFAGEVFPTKYLSRIMQLLPHADFANLYGPTETNVCTFFRVPAPPAEEDPPISIGRAISNVETFVVDEAGEIANPGTTGELYVRGGTVMRGYWGDPDKTAATRIDNPFGSGHVYKTGDLVIEGSGGNYTFLGRRDSQIKSRGYRIELGDIEAALNSHPDIVESVVVAIPDEKITNRILAAVATDDAQLDPSDVVKHIGDLVPKYMVPESIEIRDRLPKTSTGKLDRVSVLHDLETTNEGIT